MNRDELTRDDLLARRRAAQRLLASLTRDFEMIVEAARSVSTDDEHDPEGATIAFERAQVDAMLTRTHAQVGDLEAALARCDTGVYGRCEVCGREIPAERLAARPAALSCVACAAR